MKKIFTVLLILITTILYSQENYKIATFSYDTNLYVNFCPENAHCLEYKGVKGGCTYFMRNTIHICSCHINKDSKLKIGLLTNDLPIETGSKQVSWKIYSNIIEIIFQKNNELYIKKWYWDHDLKKLVYKN